MWQIYAQVAQDLIRERQREAAALALARAEPDPEVQLRPAPVRPSAARLAAAGALRRLDGAATAVSRRAGEAATRLDGRTA